MEPSLLRGHTKPLEESRETQKKVEFQAPQAYTGRGLAGFQHIPMCEKHLKTGTARLGQSFLRELARKRFEALSCRSLHGDSRQLLFQLANEPCISVKQTQMLCLSFKSNSKQVKRAGSLLLYLMRQPFQLTKGRTITSRAECLCTSAHTPCSWFKFCLNICRSDKYFSFTPWQAFNWQSDKCYWEKKNMMLKPMALFSSVPSSIISPFRRLIKYSASREEGCGCMPLWRSICWAANAGWPRKSIFLSEHMPWTVLTEVLKWESKHASFHDRRCVLSFPRKRDLIIPVKGSLKQHKIRLGSSW